MRDARTRTTRRHARPPGRGFTLVELLVVIAIIGILVGFILVAAQDAVRRAEEKATLSLINKLEIGLSERVESILIRRADVVQAHFDLAAIWNNAAPGGRIDSDQRAQVIAQFDLVKAELPDVFFVQTLSNPSAAAHYPINFASIPYNYNQATPNYFVPLGSQPSPAAGSTAGTAIGVYGATYQAAGGLYKNLGYLPTGYDGIDNNGNGLVDDLVEGIGADPLVTDPNNTSNQIHLSVLIQNRLAAHTHNTARSEMLYALLVEGQGPLGSVFARDEFTQREVQDTDNDGLPEFVDAWGQPLQFYRWPIYYNGVGSSGGPSSYVQKGMDLYAGLSEVRQTDPFDPGQTLMAPAWFSTSSNNPPVALGTSGPGYSGGAGGFMTFFGTILDPNVNVGGAGQLWDRSGFYPRRAFYSRSLIISSGPDKELGVGQLNFNYSSLYSTTDGSGSLVPISTGISNSGSALNDAAHLISIENQAGQIDPNRIGPFGSQEHLPGTNLTSAGIRISGQDDITNQGLASPGGGVR